MVWLCMVHYEVFQLVQVRYLVDFLVQLLPEARIHRVDERRMLAAFHQI